MPKSEDLYKGGSDTKIGGICICGVCRDCRREDRELAEFDQYHQRTSSLVTDKIKKETPLVPEKKEACTSPKGSSRALPRQAGRTKAERRAIRYAERVMLNGRWYAPNAPSHGCTTAYQDYGCRCIECRQHVSEYRAKQKQNKENQDG